MAETLTAAERRFRLWMYISAWMYGVSGLFFLIAGWSIAPAVNAAVKDLLPLPLYPLPAHGPEGAFWRVLAVSMMAMITYICRAAYLDLRRNAGLVPLLLLSKFCSSAVYLAFFAGNRQFVHLVGALTDGPLFLVTLWLWLPASGGGCISATEEDILAAVGDALMPRGGPFETGFADVRGACIADARTLLAGMAPAARAVLRLMLHLLDLAPLYLSLRPATLRRLPLERRAALLHRIDSLPVLRYMILAVKINILSPFFNRPEIERIVGWTREEAAP